MLPARFRHCAGATCVWGQEWSQHRRCFCRLGLMSAKGSSRRSWGKRGRALERTFCKITWVAQLQIERDVDVTRASRNQSKGLKDKCSKVPEPRPHLPLLCSLALMSSPHVPSSVLLLLHIPHMLGFKSRL